MPKYGKRFRKNVRKVMLSYAEPKHINYSYGKIELYHNSHYSFKLNDPNYMPTQGPEIIKDWRQMEMGGSC